MTPEIFERSRLSTRENEILEAAIEGMTDIQISQKMGITQSTVNSYWVRIRGKLGQLSRTELVALALKQLARDEIGAANLRLEAFRRDAETHAQQTSDHTHAELFRATLAALPDAVVVWDQEATIRYANPRLEAMFGFGWDELVGRPVSTLVPGSLAELAKVTSPEFMRDPKPARLGLGNVIYGHRRGDGQFRIILVLDGGPTSAGPIVTCIVRDFMNEIQTRKEFVLARG